MVEPEIRERISQPLHQIMFRLEGRRAAGARWVALVGSFNRWDSAAHWLTLDPQGFWTISVLLPPGTHPYLFLVDGHPFNDPEDDGRVPCEWGGWYSVRVVRQTRLGRAHGRAGVPGDARALLLAGASFDRLFCVYVLDLLPARDLSERLAGFRRVLVAGGRMVPVTLTEGVSLSIRLLTAAWKALYAVSAAACGGCRPLQLAELVRDAGFRSVWRETVVHLAVPSEIVVATRRLLTALQRIHAGERSAARRDGAGAAPFSARASRQPASPPGRTAGRTAAG